MALPAAPAAAPPASTVMSRFRQRLFPPRTLAQPASGAPARMPRKALGFQASVAEFLLVTRLRARHRTAPSADVLERATGIVFVTCQNWFAPDDQGGAGHRTRI